MNTRRVEVWSSSPSRPRVLSLLVSLCTIFSIAHGLESKPLNYDSRVLDGTVSLNPTVEYLGPLKTRAIWQMPSEKFVRKVLIIFVAHGVNPGHFWDPTPNCPQELCSGLPESRRIVLDALSRNYAVFVPESSTGDDWTVDTWPVDSPALRNVVCMLSEWKRAHGLEGVPNVALGMSAGNHAICTLSLHPGLFESITVMVSGGRDEVKAALNENYPPTFFVYMPKDERTELSVMEFQRILTSKGVRTDKVAWYEQPVTRDWFSQQIPGLDLVTSDAIVSALKDAGGILDANDLMIAPPSDTEWQAIVRDSNSVPEDPNGSGELMFEASIVQELDLAYAKHVTVSRLDYQIFAWFDHFDGSYYLGESRASF